MENEIITTATALLTASIRMATPLTLAGLGETFSEKSGTLNIGLEGIMLSGAFFSFITAFFSQSILLGVLGGCLGGIFISMIHGYLSVRMRVDQTIVGLALNFLALGLTSFFFLIAFGKTTDLPQCPVVPQVAIPGLKDIPVIGTALFNQDPFVYATYILLTFSYVVLQKTEWGVNIAAIGEHPKAADAAGLNVFHTRYVTSLLNGIFGGLAGSYLTLALLGFFQENITSGKGYIALVVVILGRRHPLGVFLAAIVVGAAEALQFRLQTTGTGIPSQVFNMFPYVVTVLVLLFSIGKNRTPAALGEPYIRNKR
jgi:ABC-type uncharacterized transport system permease subunit